MHVKSFPEAREAEGAFDADVYHQIHAPQTGPSYHEQSHYLCSKIKWWGINKTVNTISIEAVFVNLLPQIYTRCSGDFSVTHFNLIKFLRD